MRQEILKILGGHSASRVLMVANELGIFDLLSDRSMSAGDLANEIGTNPKATERLCNALAAMSLLTKGRNRFRLPAKLKPLLTKNGKASLTHTISLSHEFWRFWTDLGAFIRSGRPLTEMLTLIQKDPAMLEQFIHAMRDRGVFAARYINQVLDFQTVRRVLDLGCGPGIYALEWARRYRNLKAVLYDIESVLPITQQYIQAYRLEDRVRVMAGDFVKDPIGEGYDLVLLANALQMHGAQECQALIGKVYRAMVKNGRIIIHGFMMDPSGTHPKESALFSLTIGLVTPSGNAHSISDTVRWLRKAGFKKISRFSIDVVPPIVITAIR
ncbi:MAG TPA: methyltransferase [Nitrospiria bacterium]|jgi:ubiquinone/menaquinone biosynthesis C-methylase UbiE|nr:methyltransferase [Nitrospiria bacterium]